MVDAQSARSPTPNQYKAIHGAVVFSSIMCVVTPLLPFPAALTAEAVSHLISTPLMKVQY